MIGDIDSSDSDSSIDNVFNYNRVPYVRRLSAATSTSATSVSATSVSAASVSATSLSAASGSATSASVTLSTRGARATSVRTSGSRRVPLGGFLQTLGGVTTIRSSRHATALIGIMQLAGAHQSGLLGSIGHGNRITWFTSNTTTLFQPDGPLGGYNTVSVTVLMRHFVAAERHARGMYVLSHSNDVTGAEHEDVPAWVSQFFRLFEAQQNNPSVSAQAGEVRDERRSVVAGLVGRQAPLGRHHGRGPVLLHNELARNTGNSSLRQQIIGNVDVEVAGANDAMNEDLVEGYDDVVNERPARRRRTMNGVRRRNVHMESDPASRFHQISNAYSSLDALTQAVAQSFVAPPRPLPRTSIDVLGDFQRSTVMLTEAQSMNDTIGIALYESARQEYIAEHARIVSGNNPSHG